MDSVGGLIIVGFDGTEPSSRLERFVRQYRPAGFIFFSRNIGSDRAEVYRLNRWFLDLYRSLDEPSPILAIDHEGGRVHRLGALATCFPLPGELNEDAMAEVGRIGHQQGRELFSLGFNLVFGPVYDIATNDGHATLCTRTYGEDPLLATSRAEAVRSGLEQAGLLACPKHFPGYGCTEVDPHVSLSHVSTTVDQWRHMDGFPFETAIHSGIRALMTAHLTFDAIDPERPASLSSVWNRILREDLGFSGVILPDDLCMGALSRWATSTASLGFSVLRAGADLTLFGHPGGLDHLASEVDHLGDKIQREPGLLPRIEASGFRVRTLRKCLANPAKSPDDRIFAEGQQLLETILKPSDQPVLF